VKTNSDLKAPFPFFGGKSRCADVVWERLGPVDNYVEPFAGSLAVLLARPDDRWQTGAETVNDADAFLSNFWRALAADPEQVAHWADQPVNETDLLARHLWLVNTGRERIAKMEADPDYFDAKVAGWWVWGINAWIGGGWCAGTGPWAIENGIVVNRQLPHLGNAGQGVSRKLPHLGNAGQGVNRQLPHLGDVGRGVNRQLPHLGDAGRGVSRKLPHLGPGRGVNRKLPHLGDAGRGVSRKLPHLGNRDQGGQLRPNPQLQDYFIALSARLRRVRVCCRDWSRVVTTGALAFGNTVGIFLDPPYSKETGRDMGCYRMDSGTVAHDAREWAIANGDNPRYRICLAGYEGEHASKIPDDWTVHHWMANRCMGRADTPDSPNQAKRRKERLWFSPGCLKTELRLL
jgi:site-specific DNA-adenine methylase